MVANIRKELVKKYLDTGNPISLDEFAKYIGVPQEEFERVLVNTPVLDNLAGLSLAQSLRLMKFYGEGVLFSNDIENNLIKYEQTITKIKSFEGKHT